MAKDDRKVNGRISTAQFYNALLDVEKKMAESEARILKAINELSNRFVAAESEIEHVKSTQKLLRDLSKANAEAIQFLSTGD